MAREIYIDIRNADLDEFERFIFDHDVPENGQPAWNNNVDLRIDYDECRNAELFGQLFAESGRLPKRYSDRQIEQGCLCMCAGGFDGSVSDLIWTVELAVTAQERLIHSMFDLYANLFSSDPCGHACMMWWDPLAFPFNPMKDADPATNDGHRRIQNAMFETLSRILTLDSENCQFAALHGLNHVLHPDTEAVIKAYIDKHPDLSDPDRNYAWACARGEAM